MNKKINKYLNKLDLNVSEGKYEGFTIKFDLKFKKGGSQGVAIDKAKSEKDGEFSIGNSLSKANSIIYPPFEKIEIDNSDDTTTTTTVGGITVNNKFITMNSLENTIINIIHEIFHTFGFEHPKGKGSENGIMRYPPERPNQNDANTLGNGDFLPIKLINND